MKAIPKLKRKLFLSRTAALEGISSRRITPNDLDSGLFVLNTTSQWISSFGDHSAAHRQLAGAMVKAQEDNRIVWLYGASACPWQLLNDLLVRFGYKKLVFYRGDSRYWSESEAAARCGLRNGKWIDSVNISDERRFPYRASL